MSTFGLTCNLKSPDRNKQFVSNIPRKCIITQIRVNGKRNKIETSFTLEGTVLKNVDSIKYIGVTIRHDNNTYTNNMCTKANTTLGFLRSPQDVKEAAYKGLVRPFLEYGSCVCDPQGLVLQEEIKKD